ncbi:16S rRNA (guanine966-N2)-methyltransferase [Microbacterium sp. SORGH_AS 1204]|uniref:16S rRNA (guanine(966)-N(2))-methyltransferase RsmD n=1 Tax=Microbacterium sp. SORGH_AS_1204 TaxID=3041785 RepID=UPI00279139FB|nr:16S rRNA (guanine(966)-N(2))-methyltransferase RsmD [Microbacterium sp. SORGH_AS_1204]MDQ1136929.1 16S rRNA (guanine966-N2)-methyltransferase [Microbacterium sp. SORGH_AS_1204]
MTRIISGRAGGTVLDVPPRGTRPTSDRVRESLFGALESAGVIDDARVADLFAGSGALGLESLSRGAASADLVELSAPAASLIRKNAERVRAAGVSAAARVHRANVTTYLSASTAEWDLVFLDPPYDIADHDLTKALVALAPRLSPDATVIVERAKRSAAPDWAAAGLEAERDRAYGDTTMWWGRPVATRS